MARFRPQLFGIVCMIFGAGFVLYSYPHLGEVKLAAQELLASYDVVTSSLGLTLLMSLFIPAIGAAFLPLILVAFVVGFLPLEILIGALFAAGILYSIVGLSLVTGIATRLCSR